MLTLRDLQSSKTHQVPPAGIVLGREGGDADITVRDKSVSKHHARLYALDGEWWLEDLNSANGTFVDDQKINGPVPLGPGVAFTLSNYQFEVVKIAGANADDGNGEDEPQFGADKSGPRTRIGGTPLDEDGDIAEPTAPPPRGGAKPKVAPRQQPSTPVKAARSAPPPPPRGKASSRSASLDDDFEGGDPVDLQADASLAGNPLTTLPKAIAHYLLTVPKLLFNPLGTIRDSIDNQKFPPMKGMPLLGWALPALVIQLSLGVLASLLVVIVTAARGGGFAIGTLVGGIVGAIIGGVVGGAIIAFLYHPIFVFIVDKLLKGHSDEKSRTNFLIIAQSGAILTAIPTALSIVFALAVGFLPGSAARVGPIIMLLPMLVGLGAGLISLAVSYFWFKYFEVYKWVPIVILIAMAAQAVFALLGIVNAVRVVVAGTGGSAVVGTTGTVTLTAEQQAAIDKAKKLQEEALAAQQHAGATGVRTAAPIATATSANVKATPLPVETRSTMAAATATPDDASTHPGGTNVASNTGTNTTTSLTATTAPAGATPFQRYALRRDQIEKAIADDPTILTKDPTLLGGYRNLHNAQIAIRRQFTKTGVVAPDDVVTQRLIEAETFEKTGNLVEQIHQRIFRN